MLGNFKKSFQKSNMLFPPNEIIAEIAKKTPSNFILVSDKEKGLILVPKEGAEVKGRFKFSKEALKVLKDVPPEKWSTYLYRTQRTVPVKKLTLGDGKKQISISKLGGNPLHEKKVKNVKLIPQAFAKPFTVLFETEEGDRIEINMQQVVFDSWVESKYENINHKSIKIEFYINDEDIQGSRLTYTVSPQKAESVKEAVSMVRLFKGLLFGTAKIDGKSLDPAKSDSSLSKDQIESSLLFWENALLLEEKLGVCFSPSADFSENEQALFYGLVESFIKRKSIKWKQPFFSFSIGEVVSKEKMEYTIGKEGMKYTFLEELVNCTLLGAEFTVWAYSEMKDFVVKDIKWNENGKGADIYIDSIDGKQWVLTRFYLTDNEKDVINSLMLQGKNISLPRDIDKCS